MPLLKHPTPKNHRVIAPGERAIAPTHGSERVVEVDELRLKMNRGFKFSLGTTAIQGVLQVATTMTMARLLLPADYGLYAMVEVIVRWASLFGQTGLATVLVQRLQMSEEDWSAAQTLALGYSITAFALVFSGAPLIANLFGNSAVAPLLKAASLCFLINGLGLTSMASLRRELRFGWLGVAELLGYVLGNGVTAITLAHFGAGVWSVVYGNLIGLLVQNTIALSRGKRSGKFETSRHKLAPLVQQSVHVSANSVLDVTNNTMDTFVVARVLPQASLGLFNRALMLASLPTNFLWSAIGKVTLAGYAKLQSDTVRFGEFFRRTKIWTGTVSVAIPLAMIPAAEPIVLFLLGKTWIGVVPILRPLLLAFAFESLAFPYHSALDSLGKYYDRSGIRVLTLLLRGSLLTGVVLGHWPIIFYIGAVIGFFTWLISVIPLARRLSVDPWGFYRDDLLILARAIICTAFVAVAVTTTEQWNLLPVVGVAISAGAGALPLWFYFRREISTLLRGRVAVASVPA